MQEPTDAASNVEWKQWGDADPFFGVASWPGRERDGDNPWTTEEFYALGKSDWQDFFRRWTAYGVPTGSCVEIGSGAGRLTKHMADDFAKVTGVDVSPGMLKAAQDNVVRPNVTFVLGDGVTLPVDSASVEGVFSTHVFQHFNSLGLARANFAEAARVLAPGGSLMIHVPMYSPPRGIPATEYAVTARRVLSDARASLARRRGKPVMRMLEFSWSWLLSTLPAVGLIDVEIMMFSVASNADAHPFVLARKPAASS